MNIITKFYILKELQFFKFACDIIEKHELFN